MSGDNFYNNGGNDQVSASSGDDNVTKAGNDLVVDTGGDNIIDVADGNDEVTISVAQATTKYHFAGDDCLTLQALSHQAQRHH